ncbi:MAG TPA: hypothetical protein VE621_10400 [Bryobacteraceae bacterium]|nr:hypothetical protein [Bryobacteraceae bacterium]
MDIQLYYRKVRQLEATINEPFAVVVSQETQDGGRAGRFTEVSKLMAAKLVVDGRARLATEEEAKEFRSELRNEQLRVEQQEAANRLQVTVVHENAKTGSKPVAMKAKLED